MTRQEFVPIGRKIGVAAVGHQSIKAITPLDVTPVAADHDFTSEKIIPSVTLRMNLTTNPGDTLVGGGKGTGVGQIFVSLHDATLNPSTGLKHSANLRKVIQKIAVLEESQPYSVLIECDGGPGEKPICRLNRIFIYVVSTTTNIHDL